MKKRELFLLITALIIWTNPLTAQEVTLDIQPDFELTIDGTSNIHDWSANATEMDGQLVLDGFDGSLSTLSPEQFISLSLTIPVEDLDSGSRGLNRNLHNNLNESDWPIISFELNRVTEITQTDSGTVISAVGVITAAGEPNEVTMTVTAMTNSDGSIQFTGTQPLTMTGFEIDPPTALLGTVRARDEFSVIFSVKFNN